MRVKWDDVWKVLVCSGLCAQYGVLHRKGFHDKGLLIDSDNFKQMVGQQGVFQKTRVEAGIGG